MTCDVEAYLGASSWSTGLAADVYYADIAVIQARVYMSMEGYGDRNAIRFALSLCRLMYAT